MTLHKERQIRAKLLEKLATNKKIYLLNISERIAKECDVTVSDVTKCIQKLYMQSDFIFKYDISKTNRGIKILAIEDGGYDINVVDYIIGFNDITNSSIARYILSQFHTEIKDSDIKKIFNFYMDITADINIDSGILYLAINKNSNNIYTKCTRYNKDEIDYILNLIAKHGYSYEKDDVLYWKAYSPNVVIEEDDLINQFTVITKKEEPDAIAENLKVEEAPLTTKTAIDFIAKELGVSLTADESKNKLEEMVATVNELVLNFDSLPDWEKLKSWGQFVQDWQEIMGDAMNDRN